MTTSGVEPASDAADVSYGSPRAGGSTLSTVILLPLLLLLDGSTLVAFGAAVLVDLGKAANLAKSVFFSILVLDVLALNLIVRWLLRRR